MSHAQLITIGASHYCEKARWALDRAARPYVEKAYPPGKHRAATAVHGGTSTQLLVLQDGTALKESTDIVRWADPALFLDGDDGATVATLVADFDARLGPATRALAYIHVMADQEAFAKVASKGATAEDAAAMKERQSVLVAMMRRSMGLDEEGAEAKAKATIDAVFADVNERLAGGRRFLVGDRFSAADLTFAALASPAVDLTDVQGGGGGATPAGLVAVRKAYRATPAGEFAARMYREERGVRGSAAVKEKSPLVGDRFSAADLAFAALAAPVVDLSEVTPGATSKAIPDSLAAIRRAYRATPAGEFVARMYKQERGARGAAAVASERRGWRAPVVTVLMVTFVCIFFVLGFVL